MRLVFSRALYEEMMAHVLADTTQERCGLLSGQAGRVDRVWPTPNVLRSPVAYQMDGPEFIEAMAACGFEPLGIFHSHPAGPPVPSPTDIAEAADPDSIYVVISLQNTPHSAPSVRAFRIMNSQVSEVVVVVDTLQGLPPSV